MGLDPACNMSAQQNHSEQVLVDQGKLANVFVYVKSGLAAHRYPAPSQPVTITQRGCRYIPHLAVALAGQTIRLVNDDPAMHNIHPSPTASGNREWNISQMPKGVPIERSFATPEVMMPIKCNQHPWMKMYLNIASSPYFAVTGENGMFVIPDLPPGDYVLAAVHEKYGEKDISVHLGAETDTGRNLHLSGAIAQPYSMWRDTALFAALLLGGAGLFALLTTSGTLPLVLIPFWIIGGVVLFEVRRRRLYNKPCPVCAQPLLEKLKGGVGAPSFCRHCLTVLEWVDDGNELRPMDTGEKFDTGEKAE